MKYALALLILFFAIPVQAASGQEIELDGRSVVYWEPAPSNMPQPLVLFSHGFHGCATQSTFLMEALAKDGYWVFAPNHKDAACGGHIDGRFSRPQKGFRDAAAWDENTYANRRNDMIAVLDALKDDTRFNTHIDFTRLALAGHSLGGYTVLGLGGAWTGWKLDGVKAILALSPYAQPFIDKETLGGLSAPVMFQGGTRDYGITPAIELPHGAYEQAPKPKYFVDLEMAGHFAWTDLTHEYHAPIIAYSIAFLDCYVKGADTSPTLTSILDGVGRYIYDSEFGVRLY